MEIAELAKLDNLGAKDKGKEKKGGMSSALASNEKIRQWVSFDFVLTH